MTDELDERLAHRLANHRMGSHDVRDGEKRKKYPDPDDFQGLQQHVFPTKSWKTLVPNRSQQLLHV